MKVEDGTYTLLVESAENPSLRASSVVVILARSAAHVGKKASKAGTAGAGGMLGGGGGAGANIYSDGVNSMDGTSSDTMGAGGGSSGGSGSGGGAAAAAGVAAWNGGNGAGVGGAIGSAIDGGVAGGGGYGYGHGPKKIGWPVSSLSSSLSLLSLSRTRTHTLSRSLSLSLFCFCVRDGVVDSRCACWLRGCGCARVSRLLLLTCASLQWHVCCVRNRKRPQQYGMSSLARDEIEVPNEGTCIKNGGNIFRIVPLKALRMPGAERK